MDKTIKEKLTRLTRTQMRYVIARQEYSTKADTARAIGVKPSTVYGWPAAVEETAKLATTDPRAVAEVMLSLAATQAVKDLVDQLSSDDRSIRSGAARFIWDKMLRKPVPKMPQGDANPEFYLEALTEELEKAQRVERLEIDEIPALLMRHAKGNR